MARIPYVEKDTATAEAKELYDSFAQQFNLEDVPNVVKALSNNPKLAKRVFPLADYFMHQSALDPRLRELAVLILMTRLNCNYGFVRHISIGKGKKPWPESHTSKKTSQPQRQKSYTIVLPSSLT